VHVRGAIASRQNGSWRTRRGSRDAKRRSKRSGSSRSQRPLTRQKHGIRVCMFAHVVAGPSTDAMHDSDRGCVLCAAAARQRIGMIHTDQTIQRELARPADTAARLGRPNHRCERSGANEVMPRTIERKRVHRKLAVDGLRFAADIDTTALKNVNACWRRSATASSTDAMTLVGRSNAQLRPRLAGHHSSPLSHALATRKTLPLDAALRTGSPFGARRVRQPWITLVPRRWLCARRRS
jgi:hypothetical protein